MIFFLKMNLVTQDGIVFFSIILIGVFLPHIIIYPVIVMGTSQLLIGIFTIFASILNNLKLIDPYIIIFEKNCYSFSKKKTEIFNNNHTLAP